MSSMSKKATPLISVAAVVVIAVGAAPAAYASRVPASQETAKLKVNEIARAAPSTDGPRVMKLTRRRPITGVATIVPVIGHATTNGRRWLEVRLPGRPNGRTGWIPANGTIKGRTPWHIVIATGARRARVYRRGRRLETFRVVVGKPSTPTPLGEFFVEENIAEPRGVPGAPYALALSARSDVLQEFDGGPGQIALHGTAHLRGRPGTAASHGCVRFTREAISWLAAVIPPGVPVSIVP
jgi:lipoprotein-anchoring transpeptidase ErfK/SrfK